MFVSISVLEVAPEQLSATETAFAERPRRVDGFPGFLALEVFRDVSRRKLVLLTRWESREHFQAYMKSAAFRETHAAPHPAAPGAFFQLEKILD